MPLVPCPECGREISTAADACPGCGHPNRPLPAVQSGPQCYACDAPATTKCQKCGALSCVEHLRSIFVRYGHGGARELRCQSCYASAQVWKAVGWFLTIVLAVIVFKFVKSILPGRF